MNITKGKAGDNIIYTIQGHRENHPISLTIHLDYCPDEDWDFGKRVNLTFYTVTLMNVNQEAMKLLLERPYILKGLSVDLPEDELDSFDPFLEDCFGAEVEG